VTRLALCSGNSLQFLNTILSVETLAIIDLLLAVQIVLRERSTLSTVLAFLSNPRMQLNGSGQSVDRVIHQKNIGGNGVLTSSGSSSSSSAASSATSSEASGVSSAFGSSAGASAYMVGKREVTNEVILMVAFGRVAIG